MQRRIGITGTNGSGKSTTAKYLHDVHGFLHLEVRKFLEEALLTYPAPEEYSPRVKLQWVANLLREKFGADYVVMELYKRGVESGQDFVIESIRCVGEVNGLRLHDEFELWATDAPREIRYERIYGRKGDTDRISFEQFCEEEEREMHSMDEAKQNLSACIKIADYVIINDKESEDLYEVIERTLETRNGNIETLP